jgi:hypothetical protein
MKPKLSMLPHSGKEHFVKLIRTLGKFHAQFVSAQIISQRIFAARTKLVEKAVGNCENANNSKFKKVAV